jgi:mono/diheme cytochrome c family protein
VAKLTGGVQKLSDSEIYFIVAEGIRNTAMPAFKKTHSPEDIWRAVLWVRHLANLTTSEKAEIEQEVRHAAMKHELTMEHGMGAGIHPR